MTRNKNLQRLITLLEKQEINKERIPGLAMYLGRVFYQIPREELAKYFKVKPTRVRHFITVYGLKLQKSKKFKTFLHGFVPKLTTDQTELKFKAA